MTSSPALDRLLLACLALVLAEACTPAAGTRRALTATTTVYLTRHYEKAVGAEYGGDPPLTAAGEARAEALREALADVDLDGVYASQYERTRATVAPTALARKRSVGRYATSQGAAATIDSLVAVHAGGNLLVAGHSNTVPRMLDALVGEARYGDLDEADYGGLWRVTLAPGRAPEVVASRVEALR